jgi:hypothetical protein
MCPLPVYWSHWKRSFWKSDFLPKYHQSPRVLKRQSKEKKERKREKRGRERKAPRVSANKGEVNILRGEKYFNFKNPFRCDSIFSPSIIPFQKTFPKSLRKLSWLFLDHPLAWQYTWLELYPFPLPMSSTYLAFRG